MRADSYDWGIADLKNGDVYEGGSFNKSSGALAYFIIASPTPPGSGAGGGPTVFGSFAEDPAFNQANLSSIPPQTRALLRALKIRNERRVREGTVTVEEFVSEEGGRIERRSDRKARESETENDGGIIV